MSNLVEKFIPSIPLGTFSHGITIDKEHYIAGMQNPEWGGGYQDTGLAIFGKIFVEHNTTTKRRIWTPNWINPLNHSEINETHVERDLEQSIEIYSESSNTFLSRFFEKMLGQNGLFFTNQNNARQLITPIWAHYQPIIDSANLEFKEVRKTLQILNGIDYSRAK